MKIRKDFLSAPVAFTVMISLGTVLTGTLLPGTANAALGWDGGESLQGQCNRMDPVGVQLLEAYLLVALDLSDEQRSALAPTIRVIEEWRGSIQQRCEKLAITDAPSALREMSGAMTLTQSSIAALVPAFEAFYASLTSAQQALLNEWINRKQGD